MNAISLFSGIGGLDLSIKGISTTRLYVEIDPVCRAILARRFADGDLPEAPIHEDITTLDRAALKQYLGSTPIDCLEGGFPCEYWFLHLDIPSGTQAFVTELVLQ